MKSRDLACIVAGALLGAAGCSTPVRSFFVPTSTASETRPASEPTPQPKGGRLFREAVHITVNHEIIVWFQPAIAGYWTTPQGSQFLKITSEDPPGRFRLKGVADGGTRLKFRGKNGELTEMLVTVVRR
jgi:hypothetical protein